MASRPEVATYRLDLPGGERLVIRPLTAEDEAALAAFFAGLSPHTRRFSNYTGDAGSMARELCEVIARYDKLRMVAAGDSGVVALFEFSLSILPSDIERFCSYGIDLDGETDVRFGPCVADTYQDRGLGSRLLSFMWDIARRFGQRRVILWGGVHADNARAIRFYQKNGFCLVGRFRNDDGIECWDALCALG